MGWDVVSAPPTGCLEPIARPLMAGA